MQTNVQETSVNAYHTDALPTLGLRQKAVFECLEAHPGGMTNLEVAYSIHRPINTITPRMNELVKIGAVREVERRACRHSGRTAIAWDIKRETLF